MKREYHFWSDNHVVMFVYGVIGEIEDHPKRDVPKMIRRRLRKEFGKNYMGYKKCLKDKLNEKESNK